MSKIQSKIMKKVWQERSKEEKERIITKMSKSLKGRKSPCYWKNKKLSKEHKKKISKGCKGKNTKKWSKERRLRASGKNASGWIDGRSSENYKIRRSIEFRLWREAVFARDNWVCQKCGKRGDDLHPHHVLNFGEYPELRFAIDNGITFCKECHDKFHKKYGYKNNTKEQVEEFLGENI